MSRSAATATLSVASVGCGLLGAGKAGEIALETRRELSEISLDVVGSDRERGLVIMLALLTCPGTVRPPEEEWRVGASGKSIG